MGIIKVLLIIVEIVTSVLLIGVILLQKSKDEGLGLAFGAGVGESLFGSRAGNVLSKITIGLAIVFLVNTLLIGLILRDSHAPSGSVTDRLPEEASVPAAAVPSQAEPAAPISPAPAVEGTAPSALPTAPAAAPAPAPVAP
jgi:preprotein translocase subunit SecG